MNSLFKSPEQRISEIAERVAQEELHTSCIESSSVLTDLARADYGLTSDRDSEIGSELVSVEYITIQSGDTPSKILDRYHDRFEAAGVVNSGMTPQEKWNALVKFNNDNNIDPAGKILDVNRISAGLTLTIPRLDRSAISVHTETQRASAHDVIESYVQRSTSQHSTVLRSEESPGSGVSHRGKELIKGFEGFSTSAYPDSNGLAIGYGHNGPAAAQGTITPQKAERLLEKDMRRARNAVERLVSVQLSRNQLDSLVSFVYNIGEGAFADSTLLQKLNAGDYHGAAQEFDRWVYSDKKILPGLVRRRSEEKRLFLA